MYGKVCGALFSAFVAIAVMGCQTNFVRPPATVPTIDNMNPRARLVIGSEKLLRKVALDNPILRPLGQLTQAQVTVQSLTETRYTLEYRFEWQDDQGFNVGGANTWHRFTLTPRETKSFTSTGKVPGATRIVFTVRLPDDAFIENYKHEKR